MRRAWGGCLSLPLPITGRLPDGLVHVEEKQAVFLGQHQQLVADCFAFAERKRHPGYGHAYPVNEMVFVVESYTEVVAKAETDGVHF